jgi:hypothetical protein
MRDEPLEALAHRIISRLAGYYIQENISWETYQLSATAIKATLDEIRGEEQDRRAKHSDYDR